MRSTRESSVVAGLHEQTDTPDLQDPELAHPYPFAVHGVQHIFHPPVPLPHWPAGDKTSRFVVIGRDLRRDLLEESLSFLRARPTVGLSEESGEEIVHHRLETPF